MQFGHDVVSRFLERVAHEPNFTLLASSEAWFTPARLTPIFSTFLTNLRLVLTSAQQRIPVILQRFSQDAADTLYEAVEYYQHRQADTPRFLQGFANSLDSLVQIQRRYARHLATQEHRLAVAPRFGPVGQPDFMRRGVALITRPLLTEKEVLDDDEIWDGTPLFKGGIREPLKEEHGASNDIWLTPRPTHTQNMKSGPLLQAITSRGASTLTHPQRIEAPFNPVLHPSHTPPPPLPLSMDSIHPPSFISRRVL